MGTLTKADFESRVLLTLRNLPPEHPIIAAGMHTTAINNAPNRLIRENPDLFPEHHNRSWTIGPTEVPSAGPPVVSGNRVPLPGNLYELHEVRRNDSDTDPGTWASTTEYIVTMPQNAVALIGQLAKDSTVTGFPTICGRKDSDLYYFPTTRADFECYFRLYGTSCESALVDSGDTFLMHRDWDQAIVLMAASEVAEAIGWTERAQELLAMAGTRIKARGGVMASERARIGSRIRMAGVPGWRL